MRTYHHKMIHMIYLNNHLTFLAYDSQLTLFALMMPQNNDELQSQEVENWSQWIQGELMLPQQPMNKVTCLTLTSPWKKLRYNQ
jgi:hypothetical protein